MKSLTLWSNNNLAEIFSTYNFYFRVTLHEYENLMKTNIQFDVEVQFLLPNLCTRPSLHDVQSAINKVALGIVDISRTVHWWAKDSQRTFHSSIMSDDSIKSALERISLLISGMILFIHLICDIQKKLVT